MEDPGAPAPAVTAESVRSEVGDIPAIEGMRGIAVLWVLLFHYFVLREGRFDDAFLTLVKAWAPVEAFVRDGHLGVDLFFFITGFLLTLPWFRHANAGLAAPHARAFYARRSRRILPAYYVQLVFLFCLAAPLIHPRLWLDSTPFVVGNIGAHATFLHYMTPITSASLAVNGALWTLAIEFQYYLLLPLVAPLFVKWPWRSLLAAALIALTWRWLALNDLDAIVAWYLDTSAHAGVRERNARQLLVTQMPAWSLHFALGIVAGRAWLRRHARPPGRAATWIPVAIVAASVVALHAALRHGTAIFGFFGWMVAPLCLFAAFAAIVSWPSPLLSRLVANPALAGLGRVSYSAYLYHLPLLYLFNKFLPDTGRWLAFPLWMALLVLVSTLSYRYVERPYLRRTGAARR